MPQNEWIYLNATLGNRKLCISEKLAKFTLIHIFLYIFVYSSKGALQCFVTVMSHFYLLLYYSIHISVSTFFSFLVIFLAALWIYEYDYRQLCISKIFFFIHNGSSSSFFISYQNLHDTREKCSEKNWNGKV